MTRIRITHGTAYHDAGPVTFGPHRVLMRPREGHELRIAGGRVEIEPSATIRWLREVEGNSAALLTCQ